MRKFTKEKKTDRDKNDNENLKEESIRNDLANKRAKKQRRFREKKSNSNETKTSDQIKIEKERTDTANKIAKNRHKARINHSITLTQETSDYGDYLWIDSIPLCDISQLLINFKTTQFQKIYEDNCAPIVACTDILNETQIEEQAPKSTYWMLNQSKGKDIRNSGHWKDHPHTSTTNDIVLSNFMTKVASGIKDALKTNMTFLTMLPGFVKTTVPAHQDLHLDRINVDLETPGNSYILHVPLEKEGMQLRLGKFDDNFNLNHDLIHIPFGSGIVIHLKQLHAGHYGSPQNFRFHAVFSEDIWDGSRLMGLETYLDNRGQKTTKKTIVEHFKKDLLESDQFEMKTAKGSSLHTTTYCKHLRKFNPSADFLSLLPTIDNDKKTAD